MANATAALAAAQLRRLRRLGIEMRPGMVLGVAVIGLVGLVGIVQWNQRLILTGLIAGAAIVALNAVIVAVRTWHRRNTSPGAIYVDAEELVRMRQKLR